MNAGRESDEVLRVLSGNDDPASENPGGGAAAEPGLGSSRRQGAASKSGVLGGGRSVRSETDTRTYRQIFYFYYF